MRSTDGEELDHLLGEQLAYYRALAADYLDQDLDLPGGDELTQALDAFQPKGSVLELACGPGVWTGKLLRYAADVTAVDGSAEMLRSGASANYHAIEIIDGEPHVVRGPMGMPGTRTEPGTGRPLLCLVHVTDLQIGDVQSPTRFEFLNRLFADPRYAQIVPVQRPQETLTVHVVDATVRTLNAVRGPATGMPPQLAVTTAMPSTTRSGTNCRTSSPSSMAA
jgi:SAM-dependent methyltransferase